LALRGTHQDITARRRVERVQDLSRDVLQILNDAGGFADSVERVLTTIQKGTECDALGIRLQEGDDFPYLATRGFSQEFLLSENALLVHSAGGDICRWPDGSPCLECACGYVLSGRDDPANPHLTPGGSWWTNDSFSLLELPEGDDPRLRPRNECIHQGYESVALIPIRGKQRIVGLLQLNDRRKGRFGLDMVAALEDMASHIGEALVRLEVEDEYQTVFRRMLDGFALHEIVCDTSGHPIDYRFLAVNPAFERMTGLKAEAVVGKAVTKVMPDIEPEWIETYGKVALTGQPILFERYFRELDRYFEVAAFSPRSKRFACIFADITERKKGEEERAKLQEQLYQAQKMESVGRLAGGVAHDFNNMLQAILGYTEMVLEGLPPEGPLHDDLNEVLKVALRAASLTRQLLAFARKQTVSPEVLDLNDVVGEMLGMLRRLIGENIALDWSPGPDLWPVKIDPTQLGMILTNLCVNARDAIAGSGRISIECQNVVVDGDQCAKHPTAAAGDHVVLIVSDDGCGIDQETLGSIFEPFFTTKEAGKGTGLGLATVHGVAIQNGGFVDVCSEPGKGTSFRAYLPRHRGDERPANLADATSWEMRGGSETILVAEDEPDILSVCGAVLGKLGYHTLLAKGPDEALRLAEEHVGDIDLLLTDVVMPGMDGRKLAEELDRLRPGIPCVYMSGYAADVIGDHGVLDKGVMFVPKPFSNRQLAEMVRAALDRDVANLAPPSFPDEG
jgi:PAS domain S-box-containing protein